MSFFFSLFHVRTDHRSVQTAVTPSTFKNCGADAIKTRLLEHPEMNHAVNAESQLKSMPVMPVRMDAAIITNIDTEPIETAMAETIPQPRLRSRIITNSTRPDSVLVRSIF